MSNRGTRRLGYACVAFVMLCVGCTASLKTGQIDLAFDVGPKVEGKGEILHHDASVPGLELNWSGDPAAAADWLISNGKKLLGAFGL